MTPQTHDAPRPASAPAEEDIARRAYEIYLENGCQEGQSLQNWLQAEQELTNRLQRQRGRTLVTSTVQ